MTKSENRERIYKIEKEAPRKSGMLLFILRNYIDYSHSIVAGGLEEIS